MESIRSPPASALPDGVEIRTAKDSTPCCNCAMVRIVELRERSAFTTSQGARDITIRLSRGSVIVQAAHRSSGHLFVATADCRVAVTGTIFGVSAGAKGSRVSVIQGEVHVDQDNQEKILHPGNQTVTSPDLEPESVHEDLSWSRNRARYESNSAALGQVLSQIPLPGLRYRAICSAACPRTPSSSPASPISRSISAKPRTSSARRWRKAPI